MVYSKYDIFVVDFVLSELLVSGHDPSVWDAQSSNDVVPNKLPNIIQCDLIYENCFNLFDK